MCVPIRPFKGIYRVIAQTWKETPWVNSLVEVAGSNRYTKLYSPTIVIQWRTKFGKIIANLRFKFCNYVLVVCWCRSSDINTKTSGWQRKFIVLPGQCLIPYKHVETEGYPTLHNFNKLFSLQRILSCKPNQFKHVMSNLEGVEDFTYNWFTLNMKFLPWIGDGDS